MRNYCPARLYACIGCGAVGITKPHEFVWLGDIHCPKPYDFIGSRPTTMSCACIFSSPAPYNTEISTFSQSRAKEPESRRRTRRVRRRPLRSPSNQIWGRVYQWSKGGPHPSQPPPFPPPPFEAGRDFAGKCRQHPLKRSPIGILHSKKVDFGTKFGQILMKYQNLNSS